MQVTHSIRLVFLVLLSAFSCALPVVRAQNRNARSTTSVSDLVSALRAKAESLKSSSVERSAYESFLAAHKLVANSVSYSDFILVRLIFEATRDGGFWNMHWSITDKPPKSDEVWRQWKSAKRPTFAEKTATAECDELSALFAFLAARSRVKSVGLFWPYPNHTVAVWTLHPSNVQPIRVVIPTSQIFLTEDDTFDTKKFDPWHQKIIYDYTRRDVPDSFEIPKPLFDFFVAQLDKYAGASTEALQQIRNLRDSVFQKALAPESAAREALRRATAYSSSAEDRAAFQSFAADIRH